MSCSREWFFGELDRYTRNQYHCFVAEMFLNQDQTEYIVCFRPVNVVRGSSDQYACRYLRIDVGDVNAAHREERLTGAIVEKLVQLKAF